MNEYIGLILFGVFTALLLFRVPVSFCLGASAMLCIFLLKIPLVIVGQRMFNSLDSFPIMAIPFFILSGNLMVEGGLSRRLVRFAMSLLARIRGGLAMASVLACGMFAALSGSGPATVLSIGSCIYPELAKQGYPKPKMAGLIATAGSLGPIIPPSIIMVFFGTVTGASITKMFAGGLGAGLLLLFGLIGITAFMAVRGKWPKMSKDEERPKVWLSFKESFWALLMPVIVLGGIYGGIFTPTEAAAISVGYAFVVGGFVYRELNLKNVLKIIRHSATSSTIVLFIIAASSTFAWLITYANITAQVKDLVLGMNFAPLPYLFFVCFIMLIFGLFMEATGTIVLFMPMMFPISQILGIDPTHFGVTVCFALTVGGLTPPVAVNVFAIASVSGLSLNDIMKGEIPFLITMILILLVIILVPGAVMFFPNLLS